MKKITDFIVEKRFFIIISFIILTIISILLIPKVKINYDIAKYLPSTSETRIGMDIMEEEFAGEESSSFYLMFEGLSSDEKNTIYEELQKEDGVSSVEHDNTDKYNKDNYTLYIINVNDKEDSDVASKVFKNIKEEYKDYEIYTSGSIAERNTSVLPIWIVFLAIGCAMIILIIMCESYVEPFLFLFTIGLAVFLNKGTNIFFNSVSNITDSIVAILQLALSMDYSIMLMNRYNQEKKEDNDKVRAMKKALYNSFISISSSSITTIVGLLALIFMSFTIGRDLGVVLAKGVLFSLISIFFVLPGLILIFDKWIVKTKKKTLNVKLDKLGSISYKLRYPSLIIIFVALIGSYLLKGNLGILYTSSEADQISEVFPENNVVAIIYNNEDEDLIANHCRALAHDEKVKDALCYGNTINEDLTYDKLNDKINDLGSDMTIDDYLLKIIYYNYYGNNNNETTLEDLLKFTKTNVYTNDKMNSHLDLETKSNIERLNNFVTNENINKKRTAKELANILGIDEASVKDLLVYYNSLNNDNKLTIQTFVKFMQEDVLTNKKYSNSVDQTTKNNLNILSQFTNVNIINKEMTSKEMAKLLSVDEKLMNDLYSYYLIKYPYDTKLSLNEFATFVIDEVLTDDTLSKDINDSTKNKIYILKQFSDKKVINTKMDSKSLSKLFDIDEDIVKQILLLNYSKIDDGATYTLKEFVTSIIKLKINTDYLDHINIDNIEQLKIFALNENNFNQTDISKDKLKEIFGDELVEDAYNLLSLSDNKKMSPEEFVDIVLDYLEDYLDEETMTRLQLIKAAIFNDTKLSATELSNLLNIDKKEIYKLYAIINYTNGNTSNWKLTPYEFVNILLENSDSIESDTLESLKLCKKIMDSTINNEVYTYKELSRFLNMDEGTINSIYALYNSKYNTIKLTPKQLIEFILKNQNDKVLKKNLSSNMLSQIKLINEVINSTLSNKKYSSQELSKLLNINENSINLIYSLYQLKDKDINISLKEFTGFILDKVVTNPEYSSNFDEDSKDKLSTINEIMINSLKKYKYTSNEAYTVFTKLSDNIDKNLIELLYIYYGSENSYDNDWTLTIEKFVNYLNDNILNDKRFKEFIDDEMESDIKSSKDTIKDAKKLLVGSNYSRIVLNTELELESDETFDFVENVKKELTQDIDEYYVIGDSPMAYEMSQTFNNELNFITLLTMIFIFIVVAFTFKSILIPCILIMIIQCAVYMTMGILSLFGGTVYFISLLIVQSILMGATIDYAILYTSYYLESRKTLSIKESVINSYNKSIHTILTSSSILIIVTLIVGNFTSAIASKICKTLSQGTLCSALLILLILPAVLAACDRFIVKGQKKKI